MKLVEKLWDIMAPHDCLGCGYEGSLICSDCWPKLTANSPLRLSIPGVTDGVAVAKYDGLAKKLVQAMKIDCRRQACRLIGRALHQSELPLPADTVVTSVPTASARIRERGFDHTQLIAKEFASLRGLEYKPLLIRHGKSKQAGASKKQRTKGIKGQYQSRSAQIDEPTILLIDDVTTTGATIKEAHHTLAESGAEVIKTLVFACAK